MKPSILIIYTGGTIGMKPDPTTGALVPFDFSGIFEEFPTLQSLNIGIEVFTMDPVIDSSNVSPRNWLDLAAIIRDNYARYDGFVVLHGTDTMSYTASALSFLLENLAKPVVFTGSQIPIGVLRTDGRENLMTAIEIASARIDGRPAVPEVSLYFQNCLFRANRTTKRSSEDLSAFWSYNYPALADVGVNITYHTEYILQPERYDEPLHIAARLSGGIAVVKLFPGIEERTLRAMLSAEGLRGVVLETFGAGNAPTSEWFIRVLEEAIDRGTDRPQRHAVPGRSGHDGTLRNGTPPAADRRALRPRHDHRSGRHKIDVRPRTRTAPRANARPAPHAPQRRIYRLKHCAYENNFVYFGAKNRIDRVSERGTQTVRKRIKHYRSIHCREYYCRKEKPGHFSDQTAGLSKKAKIKRI